MPKSSTNAKPAKGDFARLEARISPAQKELLTRAASIEGCSLTNFVLRCTIETAERIVREHEVLTLGEQDRRMFVEMLLNPPKPNAALVKAAKWYRKNVRSEP